MTSLFLSGILFCNSLDKVAVQKNAFTFMHLPSFLKRSPAPKSLVLELFDKMP